MESYIGFFFRREGEERIRQKLVLQGIEQGTLQVILSAPLPKPLKYAFLFFSA
jgi:hypothetical protein